MTKAELGEIGCRLMGIFAFIAGLGALQMPLFALQQASSGRAGLIVLFLPAAILMLAAVLLWFNAPKLSYFFDSKEESSPLSPVPPSILQRILFSMIGILILVNSLSSLGNVLQEGLRYPYIDWQFWIHLATLMARLAAGAWLLFGSRSLKKFGSRLLENAFQKDW